MRLVTSKSIRYTVTRGLVTNAHQLRTRRLQYLAACAAIVVLTSFVTGTASGPLQARHRRAIATTIAQQQRDQQAAATKLSTTTAPTKVSNPIPTSPTGVVSAALLPSWTKLPFYTDPTNDALRYVAANPAVAGASLIKRVGTTPIAQWMGGWETDATATARNYVSAAAGANAVPVLVLYDIPERDCGSYSAGGATSSAAYIQWVQKVAAGIGGNTTVVVLEPDALASLDCLSAGDQAARYSMLSQAVTILKANAKTSVYLDAGNPEWQSTAIMASRLKAANVAAADGFSLNVSNYVSTASNQTYGNTISKLVSNKHFVIDTSRNGKSGLSPTDWCNNYSAALGSVPTATTGDSLNDALLWVKVPWESDGTCNAGPAAGMANWPFIVQLAQNAGW
ncbi:MAG: 1,4-beta cellobiohydrolase [Candidatus Saccharibacteria bacterium]|nr:1,4-beta cellobiohydrolase [Candidatus Saccharibacteria bacterium]